MNTSEKTLFMDLIGLVEAAGYDWLVRSNHYHDRISNAKYVANITHGTPVTPSGVSNREFRAYPAYGNTPADALENAYELLKRNAT